MRRIYIFFLFFAAACSDPIDPQCNPDAIQSIDIAMTSPQTLAVNSTRSLPYFALSECGDTLAVSQQLTWASSSTAIASVVNGLVTGRAVGTAVIRVSAPRAVSDSVIFNITPAPAGFSVIGLGVAPTSTTELWVQGDYAYTGAHAGKVYVWRISDTSAPTLVDSVSVGGSVGDLMTSPDGTRGFVALQSSGRGVAILNLDNPAKPTLISTYTTNLENGVHTLWFERINNRDYVFAVENGSSSAGGTHVIDVTVMSSPLTVAHYYAGSSFAHDIYIRDGLAFLSHWNAGMIILDVGNGIRGGSPTNPVEVSRLLTGLNSVHNIWYWPARKLAFIGEERAGGRLQVIDLADLTQPRLIGFYEIVGGTPHNFWMDEAAGLLYAAWYQHGVRVFDVNGTLQGNIAARELAFIVPPGPRPTSIWGPQLHRGVIYAADMNNGLWALRFAR